MTKKSGILRRQPADPSHMTTLRVIGNMPGTPLRSRIVVCVHTTARSLEENVVGRGPGKIVLKRTPKECTAAMLNTDFDS